MVRHNNIIPNAHFHKKWQSHIKTWFNQPMKKIKRNRRRADKARKMAPLTMQLLRPIVRCPSFRYHTKIRLGRGFTLRELKAAGINNAGYARTIGISVEHRRHNGSYESLQENAARLKDYMARVILCPLGKKKKSEASRPEVLTRKDLNVLKPHLRKGICKVGVLTDEDKHFCAYDAVRNARNEPKKLRRKLKRKNKERDGFVIEKRMV